MSDLHVRDDRELEKVSGLSLSCARVRSSRSRASMGTASRSWSSAITGMRSPQSGTVEIDGRDITGKGVRAATEAGVAQSPRTASSAGLCSRSR